MLFTARAGREARRSSRPPRQRSLLAVVALIAGSLTGGLAVTVASAPSAAADTAPPPPSGWNTVFSDNFAGGAGTAPSSANWFYDIGTGYGTGEREQTTNSTNNVYLDGNGHLVLKALNNGGTWTSGRIESTRDDFQAPPGGELEMSASIQQPNPANGLGYWPAFWSLGAPMRAGGGWPQSGEIDMMEDVNGLNEASQTLHDSANSPGHPLIACPGAGSGCQTGYHTYSVIIDRTNTSAEQMQFLMDGVVESTITEASVGTAAWQAAIDHGFFIIWDLAMGGNYPDGVSGTTTPTAATTSGASLSAAWVAVYEKGGNSTPTGTPVSTGAVKDGAGLCLTNQNSLNTEGNPLFATACNGSAGQSWSPYTDNTVRVQGGCLDVVAAGTTSGTNVDWYACNATNAQNWTRQANGELLNPNSGLCLTDPGGNAGTRLDLEACTGSPQQTWTFPTGSGGGDTVTVTNPGGQTGTVGTAASVPIHASDSASGQTLTYTASGLPAGLSINASTGVISGTPSAAGTSNVTVTATDTTGAAGSTSFSWTINPTGGGGTCGTTNLALNQPATASSAENAGTPAADAVDGNAGTRWSSAFSDPQWLQVDLGSSTSICKVVLQWETAYGKAYQIQTSNDGTNWTTIYSTTTGTGGTETLNLSGTGRYIRMNGTARNTAYGYSLWEFQVYGSSSGGGGTCGTTNLALNKPATASSAENAGTAAAAAFDGNAGTRWSSLFTDPQWVQVDLGATHTLCKVGLSWETAYATAFQIQTSNDGTNWTPIYSTTTGTGGTQSLTVSGSGRYVRMNGTARATQYGYSLWEFQVFGS
ncbi:coagulation factor 5/8 type domain protein [Catenulispora acidiphila DSM 44928]|uniref:Coagulation factor 5/8 type domain protein n=1 Tax=Catenulispora acidiphila (strain DSM 44928 / JCM 14897 / NBRC 102108 / NRRL B-24433 / ID139908) TaxID=479433 RepID=C7QGD2_CATAD|nr:discoidin domain-containing protein [Catenulispora acidiphila]ACU72977.1 coagulation factor 5/8 type domain protein [Catenulispora acidiphila DSM 44928]